MARLRRRDRESKSDLEAILRDDSLAEECGEGDGGYLPLSEREIALILGSANF